MIKEKQSSGLVVKDSPKRKLAYTREFRDQPVLSSGAIRKFLEWHKKIKLADKNKEFVDGDFKIVLQDRSDFLVRYFKVTIGQDSYFIKESRSTFLGGGATEILTSNELREILKKEGFDYAEVVKFKLGYEDEDGRVYYVAAWDGRLIKTLDDWLSDQRLNRQEREEISKKYKQLRDKLLGYGLVDVSGNNMSYDPQTKKLIIFDLSR